MPNVSASTPSSAVDPSSVDPDNIAAWEDAQEQAKDAGIRWERPANDRRTAQEIVDDSPLLKNLGNQSGVRDALEKRVGGKIGVDADATYRAVQVLEHIERFDAKGDRQVGGGVGDDKINGFKKSGDAVHGTEAGRLQDFGKYGFSRLEGELQHITTAAEDPVAREQAEALGIVWELPDDDTRSAQDIIDDNPLLRNLGTQSNVKEMLKERVGDFENDADAAYRAVQVLRHVEQFDSNGNRIANTDIGNGRIDGFTSSDEARNGTEAGRLQDFGKYGFSNLKGQIRQTSEAAGNTKAQEVAAALGIQWERPEGDQRSARQIIEGAALLKNLGNQSDIKTMLKEQVGDFENDPDAAFRAVQVLKHIETYDGDGNSTGGGNVGNGSIDGFGKSGEAKHGSEAGRLQDFGKFGFSSLRGEMEDVITPAMDAKEAKERTDAVNAARKEAGLPPLEELDIAALDTTEKDKDGNILTVTELAWQTVMADWKAGIDDGSIAADDDRAKLFRALKAGSYLDDGAGVFTLNISTGVDVEPVRGRDFEDIIDETKVNDAIAELMSSEAVSADITEAREIALGKVEGGADIVQDLKDMAFGADYVKMIQDLITDGKDQVAQDDITATYSSLLAADPDAAAAFAQNMELNAMTMELDSLMADPGMISEENLTQAGTDLVKVFLTLIKKGGLDLGRRAAEAEKFFTEMLGNKKTAKDFSAALQELGATYSKTGTVTQKDVDKVLGNGKYSSLEGSTVRAVFSDLTKKGIIGSLGGAVSLISAIYQLSGKGGTLADTPEERLAIAKDFISFIGSGKHFADLANHIIGDYNKEVKTFNENIDREYENAGRPADQDPDAKKKSPAKPLIGMDKTLDDLFKVPSDVIHGDHRDVRAFEAAFESAIDSSSKSDTYKSTVIDMSDAEYGKLVQGVEQGYQLRPEVKGPDGKPASGFHKAASAALVVMSAGADTFAGAADIVIGALTIEKGLAKGDDVTTSKGALQVAAGGFGLVGGFASSLGLVKGLSFIKAAAAPSFFISAILSIATVIPDILNDIKRTKQITGYREDMQDFFKQLDADGLLTEDGLDKFRFLDAYMANYGQRDAPDGISLFDYRRDEVVHFLEYWEGEKGAAALDRGQFSSGFGLDEDNHKDYGGDGDNLSSDLEGTGGLS